MNNNEKKNMMHNYIMIQTFILILNDMNPNRNENKIENLGL